jgi:hypothetical protein
MESVQTSEMDTKLKPVNMDHEIVYTEQFSKDKQIVIRLFARNQKYERGGRLKFEIRILITHEPLHLDK